MKRTKRLFMYPTLLLLAGAALLTSCRSSRREAEAALRTVAAADSTERERINIWYLRARMGDVVDYPVHFYFARRDTDGRWVAQPDAGLSVSWWTSSPLHADAGFVDGDFSFNSKQILAIPQVADDSLAQLAYAFYSDASNNGQGDNLDDVRLYGLTCLLLSRTYPTEATLPQPRELLTQAVSAAQRTGDNRTLAQAYKDLAIRNLIYKKESGKNVRNFEVRNDEYKWLTFKALEALRSEPGAKADLRGIINQLAIIAGGLQTGYDVFLAATNLLEGPGSDKARWEAIYDTLDIVFNERRHDSLMLAHMKPITVPPGTPVDTAIPGAWLYSDKSPVAAGFFSELQVSNEQERAIARQRDSLHRRDATQMGLLMLIGALLTVMTGGFLHFRKRAARNKAAERRNKERLEEKVRQQETTIDTLRSHITQRAEIVNRLRSAEGNDKISLTPNDWKEMEQTLNTACNKFVSRLREAHPDFSEDDIRLAMLVRLKMSNQVISNIYLITVSAVKHRKLKLKKEGFGILDPETPLEDVLEKL